MLQRRKIYWAFVFFWCTASLVRAEDRNGRSNPRFDTEDRPAPAFQFLRRDVNRPAVKPCSKKLYLAIAGSLATSVAVGGAYYYDAESDRWLPKVGEYEPYEDAPELSQLDPLMRRIMPCGGYRACGPAAGAMALGWLADHGYDRLMGYDPKNREKLIYLAQNISWQTRQNDSRGVLDEELGEGIQKLFRYHGYPVPVIKHSGWPYSRRGEDLSEGAPPPDLIGALESVESKKGLLLLSIQWLNNKQSDEKNLHFKIGGHSVFVTGYKRTRRFGEDELELFVRDPWNKTPHKRGTKAWKVRKVKEGKLILKEGTDITTLDAEGQYEVTDHNGERNLIRGLITIEPDL